MPRGRGALSRAFAEVVGSFIHLLYSIALPAVQSRDVDGRDTKILSTSKIDAKSLEKREWLVVLQTELANPNILNVRSVDP